LDKTKEGNFGFAKLLILFFEKFLEKSLPGFLPEFKV